MPKSEAEHQLRLKLRERKKNEISKMSKTRSIEKSKANFETRTCQHNRMRNKHRQIMFSVKTKVISPCQKQFKPKQKKSTILKT